MEDATASTLPLFVGTVGGPLCGARVHRGRCGKEATLPAPKTPKPEPILASELLSAAGVLQDHAQVLCDFDLTWPGDDGIRPSNIVRCEEHADFVNDDSLCTTCGFKTNPCDPFENYKRYAQDYQMHRNCNHPGPRLFQVNDNPCIVDGCEDSNHHEGTGMCIWHFVRSPQGRVAEEEEDEEETKSEIES